MASYPSSSTISAKQDFSIPFKVIKGETTYLGQYLANPSMGKNLLGTPVVAGVYFLIADEFERDLKIATARIAGGHAAKINRQVPDPSTIGTPLLRSK
jgi:hypothetical protein